MKQAHTLSLILILIMLTATASLLVSYTQSNNQEKDPVYVGVSFCGNTTAEAKLLIDRVKGYTNLFVLQSGPISKNETAANEICNYAVNAGLNIIVNLGTYTRSDWPWQIQFFNTSKQKWGNQFLGAYYDDEPGGIQLDYDWPTFFTQNNTYLFGEHRLSLKNIHYKIDSAKIGGIQPQNYTEEAQWFNLTLNLNRGHNDLKTNKIKIFTSDYALYWFDYIVGFDALLAQFGWNNSVNQEIALVRGAATMQNKDWGAILTWKYNQPPYLDSGQEIHNQMEMAYNAGAKYIIIFDYPQIGGNPYGVMTNEHFQALEKFWTETVTKSSPNSAQADAAYVLPKDYGWGMRSMDDKIWGFWGPDDKSPLIWENSRKLMELYGLRLDIIYDDPAFPILGNYSKVYFWNQTI
jgi:hypothetical protein